MDHLALLLYQLSFTTGCVSIGISLLIHRQYRKPVLRSYMLFLASLALILASLMIRLYLRAAGLGAIAPILAAADVVDKAATVLLVYSVPLLAWGLLGLEPAKPLRDPKALPALLLALLALLQPLLPAASPFAFAVPLALVYGTVAAGLALLAAGFGRVGDAVLRRALRVFFGLSLLFFPLFLMEILRHRWPALALPDVFELFSLPLYFFLLNLLSILFAERYFHRPPYLERREITAHFRSTFGITAREVEVIALLIRGESYNQIAERLFISYKTVDNHIRNIYQKTGVRNRLQLLNLLQANQVS